MDQCGAVANPPDLEAIRARNGNRKSGNGSERDGIGHHGECSGVQRDGFVPIDCNCGLMLVAADIDVLLAEVERLREREKRERAAARKVGLNMFIFAPEATVGEVLAAELESYHTRDRASDFFVSVPEGSLPITIKAGDVDIVAVPGSHLSTRARGITVSASDPEERNGRS